MNILAIISDYRDPAQAGTLSQYHDYIAFKPTNPLDETVEDENLDHRTQLTEALLNDFSLADLKLIRELFNAELECERVIWRHDNLYQLSFYLYSLGQLEDSFLLYEAKYGLSHMDASTMQDRYSITVDHEPTEVIAYVESCFAKDPKLRLKYPTLLEELQGIIDCPDFDSVASYTASLRMYFRGE